MSRECSQWLCLTRELSGWFCLILVPIQWAIRAREPVLWPWPGRKANLQAPSTTEYSARPGSNLKLFVKASSCGAESTAAPEQRTEPAVPANCSQTVAPPDSELRQWPHPNREHNSKPHLSKAVTSSPVWNPKLRWQVKKCLCLSRL